jgi:hypothetical protein
MQSDWALSDLKMKSALWAAAGASAGALIGTRLVAAMTVALAPPGWFPRS